MLDVLLLLIFLGVFGSVMMDSLWGNTLRLFNLIFAATLAASFGEPLAKFMEGMMLSGYFFYNFVGIWFVFVMAYAFFRFATQYLSRVNVRFHSLANMYGGKGVAVLIALVFVSFTLFTMHQAPLSRKFLGFDDNSRMFYGVAPDRQWHDYISWVSSGVYAPMDEKSYFDPKNDYGRRYTKFRSAMEKYVNEKEALGVAKYDEYTPKRP